MIRFLLFALTTAFLLPACKTTEKLLVKKEGEWLASTLLYQNYENGTLQNEESYSNHLVYVFEKGGTGVVKSDNLIHSLSWATDEKEDRILVCEEGTECIWFDVLQSEKDVQTWFGTQEHGNQRTDISMRMVRP